MMKSSLSSRRLLVPEVVQTSAMDCGPASLKCLLEGFRIPASYGRLREACQTSVDGTSINTMEEVAVQLGLEAEQIMVPPDHLLMPEAHTLPAIVVVRRASNATHFVVVWRRHGPLLQLMDPAVGRRWVPARSFLEEVYVHNSAVPAAAWREWAATEEFLGALRGRLSALKITSAAARRMIKAALDDAGWLPLATLDAAVRMVEAVAASGAISRGRRAARTIERLTARSLAEGPEQVIPPEFWSVRAAAEDEDGEAQLFLKGAVLVRALRRREKGEKQPQDATSESEEAEAPIASELASALKEPPARPIREFIRLTSEDGIFTLVCLLVALLLVAGGITIEALLFRGLFDIARELNLSGQKLGAMTALLVFVTALMLVELPMTSVVLRLGRGLETRVQMLFMRKIPRLGDRYFHSRLISDMAERSHSSHRIRLLPVLAALFLRITFEIILTTAGIIWLDPASAPFAILAAVLIIGLPLVAQPLLLERNLRVRNHNGGLSRFYFDSLVGLFAVRAHSAGRAVRREHESRLIEWAGAFLGLQRAIVIVEGLQFCAGFGLACWLILGYFQRSGESGGLLLYAYWVLNLPVLGQEIAMLTRQYTDYRNIMLRVLEPLSAPEETLTQSSTIEAREMRPEPLTDSSRGVSIEFQNVTVRAAGHSILQNINLSIAAGEHLAIAGASGAGKSTLVSLLLGWQRAAAGSVLVDGVELDGERLEQLRRETAWVDPAVQVWNRTFLENLRYGSEEQAHSPVNQVIELADLLDVLERLPDGLQTVLGEGGALVSGGQGQRVRIGRAMMRPHARLVILDEPFRGLERERRQALMERARKLWSRATLICISHDVSAMQSLARTVVIHEGEIVEDDSPARLASRAGSRYRALLEAEAQVRVGLWASREWRRLKLQDRQLSEAEEVQRTHVAR
ncbi:MAG TPA: ATP-binding cassette domain-containing protein [Pyrinomonadaceae bacterium]|nr:ATP-binding cassette domain-containing protein [Pyrinomonadaceae bacterium]